MATTIRLIRPLLRPPPHPLSPLKATTPQKIRTFHALLRPPTGTSTTPHRPHSHLRPSRLPFLPPPPPGHLQQTRRISDLPTTLSSALSLTQSLITTLHTTTLTPWYLTIPLLALTLHLAARLPLSLYTRRIHVRRAGLVPLLQAWRARHTMAVAASPARKDEVAKRLALTTKRVYHKWGVERWKDSVGLAAMPVWLVGIEALRRMCGGPKGLIGTVVFGPGAAEGEGGAGVGEGLAEGLSTGGCLWFPDLTVADPLHLLPFALSVVLVANVMPRTQVGARRMFGLDGGGATAPMGKTSERLRRGLVVMALAIGPVTMDLPAALHLYWLSSSTLSLLQTELTAYFMPLPNSTLRPCTEMELRFIRPRRKKTQKKEA